MSDTDKTDVVRCVKCGQVCGTESFTIIEHKHGAYRDFSERVGPVCEQCYIKHLRKDWSGYLGRPR